LTAVDHHTSQAGTPGLIRCPEEAFLQSIHKVVWAYTSLCAVGRPPARFWGHTGADPQGSGLAGTADEDRDSEVGHCDLIEGGKQQVVRFQIPMQDSPLMCGLERSADSQRDVDHLLCRQCSPLPKLIRK
jgi:hypothetical protein